MWKMSKINCRILCLMYKCDTVINISFSYDSLFILHTLQSPLLCYYVKCINEVYLWELAHLYLLIIGNPSFQIILLDAACQNWSNTLLYIGLAHTHVYEKNLPPLVLKARALNDGSAFCIGFSRLEVPEQTLGGIPLGLGMVMKINFFECSCI